MNRRAFVALYALVAVAAVFQAQLVAAESISGQWTASRSDDSRKIRLELNNYFGNRQHSAKSDWDMADIKGLDLSMPGKHNVSFVIERDAGRFDGEGIAADGEGGGVFRFTPAAGYTRDMAALGFAGVTPEKQIELAMHNVSLAFAKDMNAIGLQGLDVDKLLAFRIHGVDKEYISGLRSLGVKTVDSGGWIALHNHGVTVEYVEKLRSLGFTPDGDQLIALHNHGVTPEYITGLRAHGLDKPTVDQLIDLRKHGVTPEYVAELRSHGLDKLTVDQVIALRKQGVN